MKKKILSFIIVGILILSLLVGPVSALSREIYDKMSFCYKLKYNFFTEKLLFLPLGVKPIIVLLMKRDIMKKQEFILDLMMKH